MREEDSREWTHVWPWCQQILQNCIKRSRSPVRCAHKERLRSKLVWLLHRFCITIKVEIVHVAVTNAGETEQSVWI
jgi:hypothetical protein